MASKGLVLRSSGWLKLTHSADRSLRSTGRGFQSMATFDNSAEGNLNPSISSAEGIPVSPSVKQESAPEPLTRGIFGPSLPDCFAYFDPAMSCWKTSQGTFLSGLETYSETWPDSGTMRSGCVYELQTSERPISESGCLLWATATSHERSHDPRQVDHGIQLANQVDNWPTVRSHEVGEYQNQTDGTTQPTLTGAAQNWGTPNAHDGRRPGSDATSQEQIQAMRDKTGAGVKNLNEEASHWQTPATDSFRSRGGDRKDEMGLDQQARFFPTPAALDYRSPNKRSYQERSGTTKGEQLQNFVEHSLPDPQTQDGAPSSARDPTSPQHSASKKPRLLTRRLNPRFVELLIGLPPGWTEVD